MKSANISGAIANEKLQLIIFIKLQSPTGFCCSVIARNDGLIANALGNVQSGRAEGVYIVEIGGRIFRRIEGRIDPGRRTETL